MKRFFGQWLFAFALLGLQVSALAQDNELEKLMQQEMGDSTKKEGGPKVIQTFQGTRLINSQTVEKPGKGVLQFMISHRFGTLNSGAYNFFGLDAATIRLGLDYGISDRLAIGIGRSSLQKVIDGNFKYVFLRQSKTMPVTAAFYHVTGIQTEPKSTASMEIKFVSRLTYTHQLLVARKFSDKLSTQLMPTFIHRNMVASSNIHNDVFALGGGARYKIGKRFALTGEYFYQFRRISSIHNSLSFGFEIETGGHVFQINLSNSPGMIDQQFIAQNGGTWQKGDIMIGFNISRVFTIVKPKGFQKEKW